MCRYAGEDYIEGQMPTIGLEFKSKKYEYDGAEYNCQIWDTAGQEEYRSLTRNYYKGATVCFVVFDVSRYFFVGTKIRRNTFYSCRQWYYDVKSVAPENA